MDMVSSCKDKLAFFRIKELKDVLTQLGLPKQGKKQELVDRILSLLSDDEGSKAHAWTKRNSPGKAGVAKIIDYTYRKMQLPGATALPSKSQTSSEINQVKPKEEVNNSYQLDVNELDMKVRCPCGSSLLNDSMIKCEDPRCQVWQHIDCVIIPEKPMEGVLPEVPLCFYCEICRLNRADPFWLTVAHPLLPAKVVSSCIASDGSHTTQPVEKTYPLSRADKELLQRSAYDLQVWCILLNDKVPFRMQWPQHADLQVNGVPVRTTNRPGAQLLGINGRDDGPLVNTCSREGVNRICLSLSDGRAFSFGVRIAKRRTVQQVLNMVPKEADGEHFVDALARVCRCIGGGNATENAESDSDLEVVADYITVNLRCPMSGSRIKIAGRFRPCVHMGCFDLETFVELNQRSRKWQCPICLKNYSLENLIIDPYFNRITSLMRSCIEDVNEIDVKPDGSWRAKSKGECGDIARWHLPDGSLCAEMDVDAKHGLENSKYIKQEDLSEGQTGSKFGIKEDYNGVWDLSNPEDARPPSMNNFQSLMPISSSDDTRVNQDFDFPLNNNVPDLDSISLNLDPTCDVVDRILPAPLTDANVIVLSDSDEEKNLDMVAPPPTGSEAPFPSLDPFNNNDNGGFTIPLWQMPTYSRVDPTFQLFDTHALDDAQQSSLLANGGMGTDINGSLVDYPLAFGNDDPSLQIFLPSQPADPPQSDQVEMANGDGLDNWISLSLGGAGGGQVDNASSNGPSSKQQFTVQENDTASLLLSMNGGKGRKRKSEGPFSHPRQPRSARPRLYLSIDSGSE